MDPTKVVLLLEFQQWGLGLDRLVSLAVIVDPVGDLDPALEVDRAAGRADLPCLCGEIEKRYGFTVLR